MLDALALRLARRPWPGIAASSLGQPSGSGEEPITYEALYPRWAEFLRTGDILIGEAGTASMGLGFALAMKLHESLTALYRT